MYGVEFEEMIKIKSRTASRRDYLKEYYQINKERIEKNRKYNKINQETTKKEEMFSDNFDNEQSIEDLDTSEIKTEEMLTNIQEFSRADKFVKNKDTDESDTTIIMKAGVKIGRKRQNLSSNFNNKDQSSKYIKSKKDCMDENGWWICKSCPDEKYNFSFELINHWKKVHGSKYPSFEDLILSGKEILDRDQKFQKMGWPCGQCNTEEVFEHKFQMITHWHENHSNHETFEVCQCCCELFELSPILPSKINQHHRKVHGNLQRRLYSCNSCRHNFERLYELQGRYHSEGFM